MRTWEQSKLRPHIADDKDDGPETALVLKGFSGREEIEAFMDALLESGVVRPKEGSVS